MNSRRVLQALVMICTLAQALFSPTRAYAAGIITLDGNFGDWTGQPCISDPTGDASSDSNDLTNFCFVSDQADEIAFFYIERLKDTNKPLNLVIFIDINGNGNYSDVQDRKILTRYNANQNNARVNVDLFNGQDTLIKNIASGMDWGENGRNGASKVEFGVSFSDLGIGPGSTIAINMYSATTQGGAIDDGTVEVQWTPADALGWVLLGMLIVVASYLMMMKSQLIQFHKKSA